MTVNDLIKQLQTMSEEDRELTMVIWDHAVQINAYSPVDVEDMNWYVTGEAWTGELYGFDDPVPKRVVVWFR